MKSAGEQREATVLPKLLTGIAVPDGNPRQIYSVAAVEVAERPLSLAWGRLVFTPHDAPNASSGPSRWTMDVETISYGVLPTDDYPVRIALKDGRTLAGEAALASTNGRLFHFESRGEWKDLDRDFES